MKDSQKKIDELREKAIRESPASVEYLEKLAERNWNAIQKFYRRTTKLLVILAVSLLVLGIISINLSSETHNLTQENSKRIKEIAKSRVNSIKLSCEEQNDRHQQAKVGIEDIITKQEIKKKSIEEFKKQQILVNEFIQALVPSYNCIERIRRFTK